MRLTAGSCGSAGYSVTTAGDDEERVPLDHAFVDRRSRFVSLVQSQHLEPGKHGVDGLVGVRRALGCPSMADSEEVDRHHAAGEERIPDALPNVIEVLRWAERQRQARPHEVARREIDGRKRRGDNTKSFCHGGLKATSQAALGVGFCVGGQYSPTLLEEGDGLGSLSETEVNRLAIDSAHRVDSRKRSREVLPRLSSLVVVVVRRPVGHDGTVGRGGADLLRQGRGDRACGRQAAAIA